MPKILPLLLTASLAVSAAPTPSDWSVVQGIAPGAKVMVVSTDRAKTIATGTLARVSADSIAVTTKKGEISFDRAVVKAVKIADARRRRRDGIIGVAAGAGAGLVLGGAICPYCPNEGDSRFVAYGAAIGAGLGALAFISVGYRDIYKAPKR